MKKRTLFVWKNGIRFRLVPVNGVTYLCPPNIQRVEGGWQMRLGAPSQFASDSGHGGAHGSLQAAVSWMLQRTRELTGRKLDRGYAAKFDYLVANLHETAQAQAGAKAKVKQARNPAAKQTTKTSARKRAA